jgi:plasmid stabilization system protein ParE
MWRLDVSSEAELEIFEAALRYERERPGLGFRFEAQVNTVFARLLDHPFQFPEVEEGARRALVRDFPYGVFFTAEDDLITVLAVLHLHRHPDTWKDRRDDPE